MSEQIAIPACAKPVTLRGQHVQLEPLKPAHADDTVVFSIIPSEWQAVKTNLLARLGAHA